jgi:glucose-1-phosphate thymidylyltransferase
MGLRVIIPVAGEGTRMRPHTYTKPKVLIQVAGKPMLDHILDELKQYEIDEVCLVVGHMADAVREHVTQTYDYRFQFVTQEELLGLGHAVWMTRDLYRESQSPLLVILGDTIFDADFKRIIGSAENWIGVKEIEDPRRFGIAELEGERIVKMVEKPDNPTTNLAIIGIYYFAQAPLLFECLDKLIDSGSTTKGEFQITDAMQLMIEQGAPMRPFLIDGWYDCGKPETLLATNRRLLEKAQAEGRLPLPPAVEGSLIVPPVAIGENVTIECSIVGPGVTVATGASIRGSIVRDSVVSQGAEIENMVLEGSIVAEGARAAGRPTRLNLGNSSQLELT